MLMPAAEADVRLETTMTTLNTPGPSPDPAADSAAESGHASGSEEPAPADETPTAEPDPAPESSEDPANKRVGKVFVCAVGLVIAFMLWATIAPDTLADIMTRAMTAVSTGFGWIYLVVPFAAIAMLVWFASS
jgi:glycine betaine transporter